MAIKASKRKDKAAETGGADATLFRRWQRKVKEAKDCRRDWEEKYEVRRCEEYVLGDQYEGADKNSTLVLNYFSANIDTDLPNLFYQEPKWFIRPTVRSSQGVELRARTAEAALEAVARQDGNLKNAGKLAVFQAYFRIGVLETIYSPTMVKNPDAGQPMYQTNSAGETMRYPAEIPGPPTADPMTGQMVSGPGTPHPMAHQPIPLMGQDGKALLEPEEIQSDDQFRWEWIDAAMMLLDPDGGPDRTKWSWIGKEVVMPLSQAKTETKFRAGYRQQLEATEQGRRRDQKDTDKKKSGEETKDEGFVRLYCCWDITNRHEYVLAEGQSFQDFLYDGETDPALEDHPFSILSYKPILGPDPSPWPKPMVYDWLQPQADYNKARWLIREHAERILPREVYDDGTFPTEAEIAEYTSGGVAILAKVNSTSKPPVPVPKMTMNEALPRVVVMTQQDLRVLTGQSGSRLSDPDADTATEAALVDRAANLRDSAKQDAINDWLAEAGRKMLKFLRRHLTFAFWVNLRGYTNKDVDSWLMARGYEPTIVRQSGLFPMIVQLLGEEKWDEVRKEDLDFDADVYVIPGSARARNLEVERKQWLDFMAVIGANPQILMSRELLRATAEKFETVNERMIDELVAMGQRMLQAKQQVAGHAGAGDNGGNTMQPGSNGGMQPRGPDMQQMLGNVQALAGRAV